MININPNLAKYIDSESLKIVALIKRFEQKKIEKLATEPYMQMPNVFDLGEINKFQQSRSNYAGQMLDVAYFNGEYKGIIAEKDFLQVRKLVEAIHKDRQVNNFVSIEFTREIIIDWVFETDKNGTASKDLSATLLEKYTEAIKEYTIQFPILYLMISFPLRLAGVEFLSYSEEEISHFENDVLQENSLIDSQYFEYAKTNMLGRVFAKCTVKAELGQAKKIAFKKVSNAVDILKITSETISYPEYELFFDIDSRVSYHPMNNFIYSETSKPYFFSFNSYRHIKPNELNHDSLERMYQHHLVTFVNFLTEFPEGKHELKNIIIRSITAFAKAVSNPDLHQRIIEIYSILESLLVVNSTVQLNESVCKYCSRLVTKDVDDRSKVIKTLKDLYNVRSAMVHHANPIPIDVEELGFLQRITNHLLFKLIQKSEIHTVMKTVLDEIDSAILAAG